MQRRFSTGLLALVALPVAFLGVLPPQVLILDVRETGAGGHRFVVPLPIALVRAALWLVPNDVGSLRLDQPGDGDLARRLVVARQMVDELRGVADAELVRVRKVGETVTVATRGGKLVVDVRRGAETVRARLPLAMLDEFLKRTAQRQSMPDAVAGVLGEIQRGQLVHVETPEQEVRVSAW